MTLESPLDCKEIQPVLSKGDKSWVFFGSTDAKAETPILSPPHVDSLKRLWYWKGLRAGGEGDDRIWDGWMVSPWTWVWASSGSWWWTEKPGVLQSRELQRVRHNWATEQFIWLHWAAVICTQDLHLWHSIFSCLRLYCTWWGLCAVLGQAAPSPGQDGDLVLMQHCPHWAWGGHTSVLRRHC